MGKFYKGGLTVSELAKLCGSAVENGYGDALVIVQADADNISDIVVNGVEGYGEEFGTGPKIFSLVSSKDKESFEACYGSEG